MPVPNSFASATTSIPLSQLDQNFNTPITLGNTAIQLGNTVTTLNNMTLANATVSSGNVTVTSASLSGNLTFTGTGNRITGDFSNATVANRVIFQTSTTNGNTVLNLIPNGTGTVCAFGMDSDPALTNSSTGSLNLAAGTDVRLTAGIRGTGSYLPMTFYTGGSERMRVDTSGNVGIGTSSPAFKLDIVASANASLVSRVLNTNTGASTQSILQLGTGASAERYSNLNVNYTSQYFQNAGTNITTYYQDYDTQIFRKNDGTERARIDSSGNLLVGKTTSSTTTQGNAIGPVLANFIASTASPSDGPQIQIGNIAASVANGYRFISFRVNAGGTEVGSITTNGTSSTAYGTSSDYRLKENIAPMTGALAKVAALKPCTYTWKSNGSAGEGFIAHELQAIVPDAVIGEKDAVNEDGSIKPQNIDTSFLVATLTAAIQEQQAMIEELKAKVAALKGA
jgi:hypothetical protein